MVLEDFDNIEKRRERIASLSVDEEIRPDPSSDKVKYINGHDNIGYVGPMYNTQLWNMLLLLKTSGSDVLSDIFRVRTVGYRLKTFKNFGTPSQVLRLDL